jgi:hypothetical protein
LKEALAAAPAAGDNPACGSRQNGDDHQAICGPVALAASAVVGRPGRATLEERQILDDCEVGGGGNDIRSVQSHYDADRNEIAMTMSPP